MANYRKYEKDERVALHKCMHILQAEIDRATREYLKESEHENQNV